MRERWRQSKWSCDPMEQTPSTAESVNKVSQRGEPHSMGRKAPNFCRRRTKWSKKTVQEELDSRTAAEQGQRHGTQELPLRWNLTPTGWKDWLATCTPALPVLRKRRQDSSVNGGQAWPRHSRPASATDTALKRRGREGKKGKWRWDQRTQIFETLQIANHRLFF